MSSTKIPHVVRTAFQNRQKLIMSAVINRIGSISPTVKHVELKTIDDGESGRCEFKAGQWLDLFVPGIDHIGGFSMCSSPRRFDDDGLLELAIKASDDPVAKWIHEKCQLNDRVRFRFGGDFYYDPSTDNVAEGRPRPICLIAGGVGINPLLSILEQTLEFDQRHHQRGERKDSTDRSIVLIQAAKSEDELLFLDRTRHLARDHPNVQRFLFCTEPKTNKEIINRRITVEDLRKSIDLCRSSPPSTLEPYFFICGPSSMIDDINSILLNLGIEKGSIHFEKWS